MRTLGSALLLLAALGSSVASGQELTPEIRARLYAPTADVALRTPLVRVPMRGTDHSGSAKCPYFQVYVNGRGPFTFLYDLGAAYTVVSSDVVRAARPNVVFDRKGRRDVVNLDSLSLGGVTLHHLLAIHTDDSGVDGIIGFPTLGKLNVLFDISRRELLVSKAQIPMRNSFALPYTAPLNIPTIPVRIGNRTVPLLPDTGDDTIGLELRSVELGDAALDQPPTAGPTVMNGATRQQTKRARLKDPVKLGPVQAVHAHFAINDDLPVSDFGVDALKQFRFEVEPGRQMIEFQPLFEGREFQLTATP